MLVRYVIHLTNSQLSGCEWWINYTTADRKFRNTLKECEEWKTGEIVGVAARTQALTIERTLKVARRARPTRRDRRTDERAWSAAPKEGSNERTNERPW